MSEYVGLDVSLEGTSVCILDDSGRVMLERSVVTDPESIATCVAARADSTRIQTCTCSAQRSSCKRSGRL
jgi:hypothetical protein